MWCKREVYIIIGIEVAVAAIKQASDGARHDKDEDAAATHNAGPPFKDICYAVLHFLRA